MKARYKKRAMLLTPLLVAALLLALVPAPPVLAATTVTLYPTKDTYISWPSNSTNYGSATSMQVGAYDYYEILIQFDLSSLPEGATISSAGLKLYCYETSGSSPSISTRRNSGDWSESTVTWMNSPGCGSTTASMTSGGTGWKTWNVKNDIAGFYNGTYTNYGWTMTAPGIGYGQIDKFRTKEYTGTTYDPYLEITYTVAAPAAPTGVEASDGAYADRVVVSWTKSTGATGYQVYRDGVGLGWLGDVASFDDTGAGAPTITPGSASASDGDYTDKVALSLSGASTNNGDTHTYKVVARNDGGSSPDSATDTGYRGPGALSYQWQRSAADSNANYANIVDATTASYDDTGAPLDGSGRYYRCVLNADGAATQTSAADRGFVYYPTIEISAPDDITGWTLTPDGAQPNTASGTLRVTSNSAWQVSVSDADAATGGHMTDWDNSDYGTTQLTDPLMVAAQGYEVTLPDGGVIADGSGDDDVEITFEQNIYWTDPALPDGHSYRIIITFTGSLQ